MKTMPAGVFKTNCLAIMDEVNAKRETVVITKHGQPVAKLVPVDTGVDEIFGFFSGKGSITGDVVSPRSPRKSGAIFRGFWSTPTLWSGWLWSRPISQRKPER